MLRARLNGIQRFSLLSLAVLILAPPSAAKSIWAASASAWPTYSGAKETAVLAGGCFWGVEAVFRHVKGVKSVMSGFAVGAAQDSAPGHADRGYAEAVRVVYDPLQIGYQQLLEVFFVVAHDPTQLNRQGPDVGPEYRSAIFVSDSVQRAAADAYLAQLRSTNQFPKPIVTEVILLRSFRQAEDAHQDYVARHPQEPYVIVNDAPKLAELQRKFPALYHD
jgi:peptide-methionine (S)-S-oxide reductase